MILIYLLWALLIIWLVKKAYLYYLDQEQKIDIDFRKDQILKSSARETDVADFALLHGSKVKMEKVKKFLKGENVNE